MDLQENVYAALDYAVAQKILPLINGYGEMYAEFLQNCYWNAIRILCHVAMK